jgi:NADPH-dependent 2,4-dienoyl-CoA reductase/sulfur reductase-like enzyme
MRLFTVYIGVLVCLAFIAAPAMAKKRQGIDYAPCRAEVRVTGDARPSEGWASAAMEKKWREEVKARFGEAFTVVANARDIRSRCYPGPLKTTRCEMIARPCEVKF